MSENLGARVAGTVPCYTFEGQHYLRHRHDEGCDGDCSGCQPCTEAAHCGECRKGTHLGFGENTCPECVGKVRKALGDLLDLYAALPGEAVVRGVHSEAANLHGPATNAEAWSYRKAAYSLRTGIPLSQLEEDDEHHPLNVLRRWVQALGEDYGDPTDLEVTMSRAVDYLDLRLGRIAHDAGQDFGLFAAEVKRCRAHLEAVLHDGLQRDTGAPCMTCRVPLERTWGADDKHDGWKCPRCHATSTHAQYLFAVQHLHREEATDLTAEAMEIRTGVKAGTVRVWASRGLVKGRQDSGQRLYSVADVEARIKGDVAS